MTTNGEAMHSGGATVLKVERLAFDKIKVTVRHVCGHSGTYVVRRPEQARLAANRVCEACAPPA
jgi:hypothetical protein